MPDLTMHEACPTCGRPYDPPAVPDPPRADDPWTWHPNAAMTRRHAYHRDNFFTWSGESGHADAACGAHLPLPTVGLSGDMPPKCKKCLKVVSG